MKRFFQVLLHAVCRFLQAAQACRFWPDGRGIFHNDNKTFLVWVNEEDHLRIISMQKGGDLLTIYKRLINVCTEKRTFPISNLHLWTGLSWRRKRKLPNEHPLEHCVKQ